MSKRFTGPKLGKLLQPSQVRDPVEARAAKAALKAKRDELRAKAKEQRFWACRHVATLPVSDQKRINAAYKKARLAHQTNLSYARWCAELFRQSGEDPSQHPGAIKQAAKEYFDGLSLQ